jgi:hypothetical protein
VDQGRQVKGIVHRVAELDPTYSLWIDAWCTDQDSEVDLSFNIGLLGRMSDTAAKTTSCCLIMWWILMWRFSCNMLEEYRQQPFRDYATESTDPRLLSHAIEESVHRSVHTRTNMKIE